MTVVIFQVVTGLIGLVSLFYKQYQANAPAREKEAEQDDDEKLRKECLDLDANAISLRIDSVLNPASGDTAGIGDNSTETGTSGP